MIYNINVINCSQSIVALYHKWRYTLQQVYHQLTSKEHDAILIVGVWEAVSDITGDHADQNSRSVTFIRNTKQLVLHLTMSEDILFTYAYCTF